MKRLADIQNLPIETRVKILWILTAIVAVGLVVIWVVSTTQQVKKIGSMDFSGNALPPPPSNGSVAAENKYTAAEWVERKDGKLLIYFKVNNTTASILNFSHSDQITLTVNDEQKKPSLVTDRQGNPFVVKVLSQTQNFGIATFDDTNETKVELKFDGLFFENDSTKLFYETINLDLNKLIKTTNS